MGYKIDDKWLDDGTSLSPKADREVIPEADNGAGLGSASVRWSDLFLASGAVINFDNGNTTLTHAANALTVDTNASTGTGVIFDVEDITTGVGVYANGTANNLTSGTVFKAESDSTAADGYKLVELVSSGAAAAASKTRYGGHITMSGTGTTSTNVGLFISASGATTNREIQLTNGAFFNNSTDGILYIFGGDANSDDIRLNANTANSTPYLHLLGQGDIEFAGLTGQDFLIKESTTIFLTLNRSGSTYTTDATTTDGWTFAMNTITEGEGVLITGDSDVLTTGGLLEVKGGAASDKSWLKVIENANDTEGTQVIIDGSNAAGAAAKPSLRIGSVEHGFYPISATAFGVVIAGALQFKFSGDLLHADKTNGITLINEDPSATNPGLAFNQDEDTGIGSASADNLSLIAGGVEGIRITEAVPTTSANIKVLTTGGTYGDNDAADGDYINKWTATINDTNAGTTEDFNGLWLDLTTTDVSGYGGEVYLMRLQDDSTDVFTVQETGEVAINGAVDMNSSAISEIADLFMDDGGTIGISGNELITFNSAGNIAISGATLAMGANNITGCGDIAANDSDGPTLINVASGPTTPTVIPQRSDPDTGFGDGGADSISIIVGGVEGIRITEATYVLTEVFGDTNTNIDVFSITADGLTTGTAFKAESTSTAGGAGGDTKLIELIRSGVNSNNAHTAYGSHVTISNTNATSGTNTAYYASASGATTANYSFYGAGGDIFNTGDLILSNASGPTLLDEVASSTNPTLIPNRGDADTGIGLNAADNLSIVVGGAEGVKVEDPADLGAGETSLWLFDDDNNTVEQVTVGIADSGGAGFKLLRIAN